MTNHENELTDQWAPLIIGIISLIHLMMTTESYKINKWTLPFKNTDNSVLTNPSKVKLILSGFNYMINIDHLHIFIPYSTRFCYSHYADAFLWLKIVKVFASILAWTIIISVWKSDFILAIGPRDSILLSFLLFTMTYKMIIDY